MAENPSVRLSSFSAEQRAANLQKAQQTRAHRAEFIARIRTGQISGSEALDEALGDEVLVKTRLTSFLKALPGWGRASVRDFFESSGIAENRRLGGLGRNQLDEVRRAVSG